MESSSGKLCVCRYESGMTLTSTLIQCDSEKCCPGWQLISLIDQSSFFIRKVVRLGNRQLDPRMTLIGLVDRTVSADDPWIRSTATNDNRQKRCINRPFLFPDAW